MGRGDSQPVTLLSRGFIAAVRVQMARKMMDQTRLAEATGLSAPYLSKRLTGKMVFTLHDLERIAHALGVDPEALLMEAVREAEMLAD